MRFGEGWPGAFSFEDIGLRDGQWRCRSIGGGVVLDVGAGIREKLRVGLAGGERVLVGGDSWRRFESTFAEECPGNRTGVEVS